MIDETHFYSECNLIVNEVDPYIWNEITTSDKGFTTALSLGLNVSSAEISGSFHNMCTYLTSVTSVNLIIHDVDALCKKIQKQSEVDNILRYINDEFRAFVLLSNRVFSAHSETYQSFSRYTKFMIVFASEDDYVKFMVMFS